MQSSNSQPLAQWEWKSNPNPYSQVEEAQWTPYNPFDNLLLEKAYYDQQNEVDLGGDYIVSIKDMLQKKKNDAFRQRPIRRNTEYIRKNQEENNVDQDENIRAKRFFGAEAPKTFNKAFGNLQDYLKFFQNRGPDIKEFANLLNDIETANNLDLLNDIVQPCLIKCLQNEAKKIPNQNVKYEKQLFELFQGAVKTLKQFYANVLKAYTLEGFLYQNLNHYLRNENWSQLDSLLPYLYCLCKAFLHSELASSNHQNVSMTVYRGAQFDEAALSQYDLNLIKNFCWNGVTSTSRSRHVAEQFMLYNFDSKKKSVLFIIEVPLTAQNTLSNWIDIKPYSAIPHEDEIVLPPGSVFELIQVSKKNQKCVEIYLKLVVNVETLAHQGQIMHGALHSEMSTERSLKLVCLEGRELTDTIAHLKGNRLIEELEFCLCQFDGKFKAELLLEIPNLKSLCFVSPLCEDNRHWRLLFEQLEKSSIEKVEVSGDNILNLCEIGLGLRSLKTLQSLNLNVFKGVPSLDEGLSGLASQGLKYLTSLTSLSLDFTRCYCLSERGLNDLSSQGLKYVTSLKSLTLNFERCSLLNDEGIHYLSSQGLKYLTSLTSLTLNFGQDDSHISDEGLKHLSSEGLKYLTSLRALNLSFKYCSQITDEGLQHLSSQGLTHLTTLTSLALNLEGCQKIKDEGLKNFSSQGLTSLTSLILDFTWCPDLTYEGLKSLNSQGLKYLTSLTSLSLNFSYCRNFGDEELNSLTAHGLRDFTSLTSLSLVFKECNKITDEGMKNLTSQGLKYLTSLASLNLDFTCCDQLTAEGLEHLSLQGLIHLTSLTSLTLDFGICQKITDKGLEHLGSQGLIHLTSLTTLALNFGGCQKITDEGLNYLSSQGLKHLTSLTSLALDFSWCRDLTDEGLNNLSSQALKYLTFLTSFTLILRECEKITDEGMNYLSSQGLKYLTSLTSLTLILRECDKITDEGMNYLSSQGLKYLTSLTSLTLILKSCDKITDEGMNYLSFQGLKYLTSLTSFTPNLEGCDQITNEGKKLLQKFLRFNVLLPSKDHPNSGYANFIRQVNHEKLWMRIREYLTTQQL